jgi:purine-binding chemotaxis protein CheW
MGVIDYKGILIPVVNVRNMFGMPEKEVDLNDQLIIANTSTRTLALWVDKVLDVIEQDEKEISKAEKFFVGAEFIKGIFKFEDGMVLIHDLDQFLTAKEISLLKAALNKEKERKREFPEKKKPDEIKKKSEAKVKATTKVKSIKKT